MLQVYSESKFRVKQKFSSLLLGHPSIPRYILDVVFVCNVNKNGVLFLKSFFFDFW